MYVHLFFFNDTATTEIYTLSLHDALPIWVDGRRRAVEQERAARVIGLPTWATAASLTPVVEPDQAEPGSGRRRSHVPGLAAHVAARRRLRGAVRPGDRRLPADLARGAHPPGERAGLRAASPCAAGTAPTAGCS